MPPVLVVAGVKDAPSSGLCWITFNKDTNSMRRMIATACWNDRCYQLKQTRRVSSWGRLMMRSNGVVYSSLWISIIKVATVTVISLISKNHFCLLCLSDHRSPNNMHLTSSLSWWSKKRRLSELMHWLWLIELLLKSMKPNNTIRYSEVDV